MSASPAAANAEAVSSIRKAAETFQALRKAYDAQDNDRVHQYLTQLKRLFIHFPTYLEPGNASSSPTAKEEVAIIRETLEHAALFCARTKNLDEFETYYLQLRSYYTDFNEVGAVPSVHKLLVMGLNLLRLLVCSRVAEFHAVLETIPAKDLGHMYIKFPIQLERHLMEGSYNKLLHARKLAPVNDFVPIVEMLEETVRSEVMACIPRSYGTLRVPEAQKLLMLNSPESMEEYATRQNWTKVPGATAGEEAYVFAENIPTAKREVAFKDVLLHNLQLAGDMQRVV